MLYQQLGCFLVCRTWSLHTYIGRLEGVERAQRRVTPEAPEANAAARKGAAINVIETEGGEPEQERGKSVAVFLFYFLVEHISPRNDGLSLAVVAGGLPRNGNLEDDRERVGDGLNKRDTRRDGFQPRKLTSSSRDKTRAPFLACRCFSSKWIL